MPLRYNSDTIYVYFYLCLLYIYVVSQVALVVKNPPANAGDAGGWVGSLGGDDPLEEEVETISSILAWEIPCTLQFSSVAQSCATLCDPMDCSMPEFPVQHQLLEFTQTCPSSRR